MWRFDGCFVGSSKPAGNDVIGIDLGTTNSCVSIMEGKVYSCLELLVVAFLVNKSFY